MDISLLMASPLSMDRPFNAPSREKISRNSEEVRAGMNKIEIHVHSPTIVSRFDTRLFGHLFSAISFYRVSEI